MIADSPATPNPEPTPLDPSAQYNFPQVKRRFRRELEPPPPPAGEPPAPGPAGSGTPEEQLRTEIGALNARLGELLERRTPAPPAPEPESRGAKYFRLTRKANAPAAARETGPAEAAAPVVLPAGLGRGAIGYRPHNSENWLLAAIGVLTLIGLSFFLGWQTGRPVRDNTVKVPIAPAWTEKDLAAFDHVLETGRSGDLREERQEALTLNRQLGGHTFLASYAAMLEARSGSLNNAEADLVRMANMPAAPRETAALQQRLGFVYTRRRDFASAANCFLSAALADPLDPFTFYYWGATLRRGGKLPEAAARFRQAMLRLPEGQSETDSLRECAALQIRLCQIEVGSDSAVKTAINEQLSRPVPSAYWLVTAVAYDLQHGDPQAALAVLQRMKVVAQPDTVAALLNDYFLRGLGSRNADLAPYFPELTADRRKQLDTAEAWFIDP